MFAVIVPALLPLLLVVMLAGGLYLVAHSAQRDGQAGRRHEPPLIFEVGGHAVWCGPHPPTWRANRGDVVSASLADEHMADGPLLLE